LLRSAVILLLLPSLASAEDGVAFFEKHIRPVLIEKCYSCHSAQSKSVKGGLLLDSKAGLLQGGDSGPAIDLKDPKKSLLLEVLKYEGDIKMPPKGKLSEQTIQHFEAWLQTGAADPRAATSKARTNDMAKGKQWWSYQPLKSHPLPVVKNIDWPRNNIDHFILNKIEAASLTPTEDADRRMLMQRLSFDLTGLPPSLADLDAFVASSNPKDVEQLIDKLLASPRFGEHWGRHWLDVTRFGESLTLRGFILKDAWRYRQYVIDAMNNDVPYDQFLREQLAGDLLPTASTSDKQRLTVATTFLALGNYNLEEQDKKQLEMDIVDEQLDVITRGFLGQTVTCARCHDHKFDPIPTKDYYALAGILRNVQTVEHANVSKWLELPMAAESVEESRYASLQKEVNDLQAKIKKIKSSKTLLAEAFKAKDLLGIIVDDNQAKKVGSWKSSTSVKPYVEAGYLHDDNIDKGNKTVTFTPELPHDGKYEVRLSYTPDKNRCKAVPVTVFGADGEVEKKINQQEAPTLEGGFVSLGTHRFEKAGQSFVIIANEGTTGYVIADAVQFIPIDTPLAPPGRGAGGEGAKTKKLDPELALLETKLKLVQDQLKKRPTRLGVTERKQCTDCKVHIRGLVSNQGETVPRGFLQAAAFPHDLKFTANTSGRRELADWITNKQNPLTARVIVNRVWLWLFGQGLCPTPDNFGTTGDQPTHPELLDTLAIEFMNDGWSIKRLIKRIVMSRTYQLSSLDKSRRASAPGVTPEASVHLFTHHQRRRLEAEALRDRLLTLSNSLDLSPTKYDTLATLPSDYNYQHQANCRSVYLPAFRNSPEELIEAFDQADPSTVVGQRNVSTVAPQALYLMNHPQVLKHTRLAAERLLKEAPSDSKQQIKHAYRLTLGRLPTEKETQLIEQTLELQGNSLNTWAKIIHALVCSLEFRYVE
jgi:hypothetical protein